MPETLTQEEAIFHAALEIDAADQRSAYVDAACGNQEELRQRVEVLLRRYAEAEGPLDRPVVSGALTTEQPLAEQPGMLLGPYKLLEQIGEGGFGVVWMAEQQQPVRRKVALKVLKPGMDTKQVVARFEAERQALALMDHPHIARVFDAGETPPAYAGGSPRPYFVMELVRGVPLTPFCDANRLTVRQRLELFVTVCQAVQHAHTKGIIHRDLKPSNVLVTLHDGTPVAKVIDFGIAKALGQQLTDKTLFTGFAQMLGTPLYMSPEQAEMSGLDVDTRSDIYSLGVMLYELLTGTTPLDQERLSGVGYDELRRLIREEEPPKPSTRLSTLGQAAATVSANRHSEPHTLSQFLRGELDWIVMKALEKDRTRRYETASAFAADLQRYLRDEPVEACPPSALYRFRKFAQRNQVVLRTASVVAVAVVLAVAALAVSTVYTVQANRDLHEALDRERELQERERRTTYFQRVALAQREWLANNHSRAEELLEQCPAELRGWEWHYVRGLRRGPPSPWREHTAPVWGVVFSPHGSLVASAAEDGTVKVWDVATGRSIHSFPGPTLRVHRYGHQVSFSPDGRRLAAAGADRATLTIRDVTTGQELLNLAAAHDVAGIVRHTSFSPDGQRIAVCGDRPGLVKVLDAFTGQECLTLQGHTSNWVNKVVFSPDGRRLATSGVFDQTVRLWDAATGQELLTLRGHTRDVWGVAFSPDGSRLASSSTNTLYGMDDGEIIVWDAQTGQPLRRMRDHTQGTHDIAFSPDGQRIASAGKSGVVKIWVTETGEEALTLPCPTLVCGVAFSPDGRRLVSACWDKTVTLWDATPLEQRPGQELRTFGGDAGPVRDAAFHHESKLLIAVSKDGAARVWDPATGRLVSTHQPPAHVAAGTAFSADGRLRAAFTPPRSGTAPVVKVWEALTGKELPLQGELRQGNSLAFSPDGRRLAAGGYNRVVHLVDLQDKLPQYTLRGHGNLITGLAFSPDGGQLVSGDRDGTIKLWDTAAGVELHPLGNHAATVNGVAFGPNRRLASAGTDGVVRVWEADTGKELHPLRGHTASIKSVAFSPDGRLLVSAGADAAIRVWDPATGQLLRVLYGHTRSIERVAFSADGGRLASASWDGTVKVWEVPQTPQAGAP